MPKRRRNILLSRDNNVKARNNIADNEKQKGVLVVTYTTNYEIDQIDERIKKSFEKRRNGLPQLISNVDKLDKEIDEAETITKSRTLIAQKKDLLEEIGSIEERAKENDYNKHSVALLAGYRMLVANEPNINDENYHQKKCEWDKKCEQIVGSYLTVASKYIRLEVNKELVKKSECCVACGYNLSETWSEKNGSKICPNKLCLYDNRNISPVVVTPKEYDTWGNFLKAHNRYIGSAPVKFNINVIMEELDMYFTKRGKKPGSYYRALPHNSRGRKDGTTQEDICEALEALNYESFYKYYMYICHHYYGWRYPDVDRYIDTIEKNFKLKQEAWKSMTVKERGGQSSLPTQFRMCMEYNNVGYKCDLDDFKVSRKQATLDRYFSVYAEMCRRCGIKYPHK